MRTFLKCCAKSSPVGQSYRVKGWRGFDFLFLHHAVCKVCKGPIVASFTLHMIDGKLMRDPALEYYQHSGKGRFPFLDLIATGEVQRVNLIKATDRPTRGHPVLVGDFSIKCGRLDYLLWLFRQVKCK